VPILCVGETIEQRRAGNAFNVVEEQLLSCLKDVHIDSANKLIIAYEPVWAIGTGETATLEIAQEMHAFIRKLLSEIFGESMSQSIKILYGGSMKPENTKDLLSQKDIDGGLIGGASLKSFSFCEMISIADKLLS
jgi:triosephosphate isomerase